MNIAPELLFAALDELAEGFALYDAEDRLIMCNQQYREINATAQEYLVSGVLFADALRMTVTNDPLPKGMMGNDQWFRDRMNWHRNSLELCEVEFENGNWLQIREVKVSSGGTVVFNTDITRKKQAQQVLDDNQTLLTQGAAMASIGYAIWDYSDEQYITVSDEYAGIHGYSRTEFLSLFLDLDKDTRMIHPEDHERYLDYYAQKDKPKSEIEYRIFQPDGTTRLVYECYQDILDSSGCRVQSLVSMQDITDFRLTEKALSDSETLLSQSVAMAKLGYAVWDYTGKSYETISESYAQIHGYTKKEFLEKFVDLARDSELIHPEDRELCTDFYQQDQEKAEIEYRIIRKDGAIQHVHETYKDVIDSSGNLIQCLVLIQDISDRKRTEEDLEQSHALYRQAEEMGNMGHWSWDHIEYRMISCSEQCARIYGMTVPETLRHFSSFDAEIKLVHPDDRQRYRQTLQEAQKLFTSFDIEFRSNLATAFECYFHLKSEYVYSEQGVLLRSFGTVQDITERKLAVEALAFQATHDPLTKLINRSEFERRLESVVDIVRESDDEHALCYMDLDRFKIINDTCGHIAGDELLKQLSVLLMEVVDTRFSLARLGGDEFGILMESCAPEQAYLLANRIRQAVEDFKFMWEERVFRIGVSIGLVPITRTSESVSNLLIAADTACYSAKDAGRNRVNVNEINDMGFTRKQIEMQQLAQINAALDEQRFQLWSQPIVPLNGAPGEGESFELLLRMLDDKGAIVLPEVFLPIAEQFGLSTNLDRWVVETALNWLSDNSQLQERLHLCFINLSGSSLADEEFLLFVQQCFAQTNFPASKICFEVTETETITNLSRAITFMGTLREQGCRFALDDFGSGLSSFTYLKTLPVDYLKIEGSFVKGIQDNEVDLAVVRSINDVGKAMNKTTIAEFVESEELLEKLREIGVDYVQGYKLGRPAPIHETT
ncbi:MAG: diguanylate cyclase (GGDEF)-like protein/PAS domain S-box-containing protein [Parasphingorhabdus sp.]